MGKAEMVSRNNVKDPTKIGIQVRSYPVNIKQRKGLWVFCKCGWKKKVNKLERVCRCPECRRKGILDSGRNLYVIDYDSEFQFEAKIKADGKWH